MMMVEGVVGWSPAFLQMHRADAGWLRALLDGSHVAGLVVSIEVRVPDMERCLSIGFLWNCTAVERVIEP